MVDVTGNMDVNIYTTLFLIWPSRFRTGWYGSAAHLFEEFIDMKYVGDLRHLVFMNPGVKDGQLHLKAMGDQQALLYLDNPISVEDADLYNSILTLHTIVKNHCFKAKSKFRKCRD
ncbi:hypothetical protein BDB01DRAFT_832116 [Pilobolus umbonatus]|nr:hypothetical protein BDB01DRAFT_832116 [Pilobolus umbonatus]